MNVEPTVAAPVELAHRSGGGIAVTLYWSRADGAVSVEVEHLRTEKRFVLAVEPDRALEAFHHPFGYSARRPQRRVAVAAG